MTIGFSSEQLTNVTFNQIEPATTHHLLMTRGQIDSTKDFGNLPVRNAAGIVDIGKKQGDVDDKV